MTATALPKAPALRLVPPAEAPADPGILERLRWSIDQMEADVCRRNRTRPRGTRLRGARVHLAREVLLDVQDVVAIVGLCLPRKSPTMQLVNLICDAIDHELGRDPKRDYTLQHQRRMARIAAAMAEGGA